MANRISSITAHIRLAVMASLVTLFLLPGCKTVEVPDLSQIDFNFPQKSTVTIKSHYSSVNIRPTPSTTQPPIATIKGGDSLELIKEEGNWLQVNFYDVTGNSKEGWIYKYLVVGYQEPHSPDAEKASSKERVKEEKPLVIEESPATVDPTTKNLPKSEKISPL